MRCLFALLFFFVALFMHFSEAASPSAQIEQPSFLDARYQKRSLANGRWGLRPGKRSVVESDVETPAVDELAAEVAEKLSDRIRRNLASGRWGLRPGKRSAPAHRSFDYVLLSDN